MGRNNGNNGFILKKYFSFVMIWTLLFSTLSFFANAWDFQSHFKERMEKFTSEDKDLKNQAVQPKEILFVGSSTVEFWGDERLKDHFKELSLNPVNRGIGGSTYEVISQNSENLIWGRTPKALVFYAGDNDLSEGKSPAEIFETLKQVIKDVRKKETQEFLKTQPLNDSRRIHFMPIFIVSVKPSLARLGLIEKTRQLNELISKLDVLNQSSFVLGPIYYVDIFNPMMKNGNEGLAAYYVGGDGLHMNEAGYGLWKEILIPTLKAWTDKL